MTLISLQSLAKRVAAGDRAAPAVFRGRLEPQMQRILRRALRHDTPTATLTRQLRLAADDAQRARLPALSCPPEARLAAHLTHRVVQRLQALALPQAARDTALDLRHTV